MYLYIYTYFCNACTRLSTSSTILYVYSTNSIPGSIFSPFFKTTDVFSEWWKLPEDVQFAILPSGRSGFGRSPFVQSRNELLLRLLLPASMSNMEGGEPEAFFWERFIGVVTEERSTSGIHSSGFLSGVSVGSHEQLQSPSEMF